MFSASRRITQRLGDAVAGKWTISLAPFWPTGLSTSPHSRQLWPPVAFQANKSLFFTLDVMQHVQELVYATALQHGQTLFVALPGLVAMVLVDLGL